ncbi:hypothetical protein J4227_01530 [Candidatus Woesearchaeota archaeon]|nr:hypothetical protein [Candidatus Woesearchaeota archaeon]
MQIIIDTSKDSPEDIKKAARFLQELASGQAGNIVNQGNIFGSSAPAEGMMGIFDNPATLDASSSGMAAESPGAQQSSNAQSILDDSDDNPWPKKPVLETYDTSSASYSPSQKKDPKDPDKDKKSSGIIVY